MIHALKTEPQFFEAVIDGSKTFKVRKNDRDFRVGDYLALNELDDTREGYTGRSVLLYVCYILSDEKYCKPDYVTIGFKLCAIYPFTANTKCDGAVVLSGGSRK